MVTDKTFGQWLKIRRRHVDFTQQALADRVGCAIGTVRKIESGSRRPSKKLAELLAGSLGISQEQREAFIIYARSGVYPAVIGQPVEVLKDGAERHALPSMLTAAESEIEIPPIFQSTWHIQHNLPAQPTPIIGREVELARLDGLLADSNVRLITIVGPGGIGKTRLALAVAERQLSAVPEEEPRFPDGVFFAALAPLSLAEHIVPALAEALGLQLGELGQISPRQQLLNYLSHKRLLLIMDNYEHLLDGVDLLADALQAAPAVQIMVTSRERLQLQGEQLYPIEGLARPEIEGWEAVESAAGQLFLQAARRIQPDFELRDSHDLARLVRICQQVGGMPLALELAAVWVDVLSLEAIAAEIQRSFDFLKTSTRNIPDRHRSMRAAFEGSWNRLKANEQQIFSHLSVFRGGFTLEAARAVSSTSLRQLAQLVAKSLLQYDRVKERYQMHELLRQFGMERLADTKEHEAAVRDRHSAYYCAFLQQKFEELKGPQQQADIAIGIEIDNCRAAWTWAVSCRHIEHIAQAVNGLGQFLVFWRGRYQEPARLFQQAASLVDGSESVLELQLLIQLLSWSALCSDGLGQRNEADRQSQKCLTLLNQPPLNQLEYWPSKGFVLYQLAMVVSFSDRIISNQLAEKSRKLSRMAKDQWGEAKTLFWLAVLAHTLGNLAEAEHYSKQSLTIHRALNSQSDIAEVLTLLAEIAGDQNRLAESERLIQESVAIYRKFEIKLNLAHGLLRMGKIYILNGRHAESLAVFQESLQLFGERGHRYFISFSWLSSSEAFFHMGQYEKAQRHSEQALIMAREIGKEYPAAKALRALGQLALARTDYVAAEAHLLESAAILRTYGQTGMPVEHAISVSLLSMANLGVGRMKDAIQQLCEAVVIFQSTNSVYGVMALVAGSLLFMEQGQMERAVELQALAGGHPYLASSLWFDEICGQKIAVAATTLPPEVAERARSRGRGLDLMETLAELHRELSEFGRGGEKR